MDNVTRYLRHYPIWSPAYRVHRLAGLRIRDAAPHCLSGRMLDIGCGAKLKSRLGGDLLTEYIGLDHEGTFHDRSKIDLLGTAYDIPAENVSFDCILSTAVLEHLEDRGRALEDGCWIPGVPAEDRAPFLAVLVQ